MGDGKTVSATAVKQTAASGSQPSAVKKGKAKKQTDEAKQQELLAARISELQGIRDGEREQEIEIEREVKKANRELFGSLANLDDIAKVTGLQNRCTQLLTDLKRLEREHRITKIRADKLQKERDSAKSDLTKTNSIRDKLEKLSRETTTENRKLRAENARIKEDDVRKRELLHERIDSMVYDVEDVINAKEQSRNHSETFETDELFRQKFKSFVDQYEMRELHFTSQLRAKDLEIAYHTAKLDQQKRAQEVESSRSNQLTRQVSTFSQTETELRTQLNIYVEKFKQVEDTLNSSNDLFLSFRSEMLEMSKKTRVLELENSSLSRKHEITNTNIIKMAEERNRTHAELETLRKKKEILERQNEKLEKLCRGMQAQGRSLMLPREHPAEAGQIDMDDDGTESEYDDYDDEDASLDGDYDDDSEDLDNQQRAREVGRRTTSTTMVVTNGAVAGARSTPLAL